MNELELLEKLNESEYLARDYEIRIQIWSNEEEKKGFITEFQKVISEIEQITKELIEIEDKKYSSRAKSGMIEQLEQYVTEINKAKPWLNLSRNQSTMLENELFSEIVRDLNYILSGKITGIHIPAYLQYTVEAKDSVSIPELTEYLRFEIQNLRKIENPNFIKLRNYRNEFVERIVGKFIE
jgi:6-pyruvoyl-tetrahydropterin synthase